MTAEEPQPTPSAGAGAGAGAGPRPAGWVGWVIAIVPGILLGALSVGIVLDELLKRLAR